MWIFWVIALIPICIGFVLFAFNRKAHVAEWIFSSVAALTLSGIFQLAILLCENKDIETWSGEIIHATHFPYWYAEWTETYTTTDSNGNTEYHTRTCSKHHYEHWLAFLSTGEEKRVDLNFFNEIKANFGGKITIERPHKPDFERGDRNIYVAYNHTGFVYPTTTTRTFKNKTLNSPNLFKFSELPVGNTNITALPDWPANKYWNVSDRLMGTAKNMLSIREWDLLNSRLGSSKKVNLIMVGFDSPENMLGQWLQSKWRGGKKNDLVLTFGGGATNSPASWSYVFGWTESEFVKQNIQSILLEQPINNAIIARVEKEIETNYQLKDWSKFDYISTKPKTWHVVLFVVLMVVSQIGIRIFLAQNSSYGFCYFNR